MNSDSNMNEYASNDVIKLNISFPKGFVARLKEALGEPATEELEKETENAYKKSCGDVESSQLPECELKQEMPTEVNNKNEKDEESDDILLNSNLNPLSAEFVPVDDSFLTTMNSDPNMNEYASSDVLKLNISVSKGFVARLKEGIDGSEPATEELEKETENAYKKLCGDVESSQPPECELKQEMPTEVNNKNEKDKENDDIVLKSNLNPLSAEFLPIDRFLTIMNSDPNMNEHASSDVLKLNIAVSKEFVARLKEIIDDSEPATEELEKETEKAFKKSSGDVESSQLPECELKQEMPTEVNNKNEKAEESDDILLKSNLNPLSAEFVPVQKQKTGAVKKKKGKKKEKATLQNGEMKYTIKKIPVPSSPINIIQRKYSMNAEKKSASLERQLFTLSSSQSDPSVSNSQYTPSPEANIYYNTYMAMTNLKDHYVTPHSIWLPIEENIRRTEEAMRTKRRTCSCNHELNGEVSERCCYKCNNGLKGTIALKAPRHSLLNNVEDCVVCNATKKHGYNIDENSFFKIFDCKVPYVYTT